MKEEITAAAFINEYNKLNDPCQYLYLQAASQLECHTTITNDGATVTVPLWAIANVMGYKLITP